MRSTVSAWPASSKAITTTAAPYRRMRRALWRKSASPSLRLIELTMPLPWMAWSPASITGHFELSIITGTRAISGSVAMRCRNSRMACSASSRPSSMFTSMMLAPPRTWSSATAAASPNWPSLMRRRNLAEPDTLVRSPIIVKLLSGRMVNTSRPA